MHRKINRVQTLGRLKKIRNVLKQHSEGLYQKDLAKKVGIERATLSILIYNFLNKKLSITKIGKNKIFKLMDTTPSEKEMRLIIRNNALQKAKKLRKSGFSYSEIEQILKKEFEICIDVKTFVRNIKMSIKGIQRYRDKIKKDRKDAGVKGGKVHVATGHIYKIQPLRMEGYLRKIMSRIPKISRQLTLSKMRIFAHCLFDGFIIDDNYKHSYIVGYCNTSNFLLSQFIKDMKKVYRLEPTHITRRKGGDVVRYCSKAVVKDLMRYLSFENGEEILNDKIINAPNEYKIEFLRAFFDDEGMVGFSKREDKQGYIHTHRFVEAFQKNLKLLKQIETMLENLDIEFNLNGNRLKISSMNNLKKFAEIINFSPKVVSCRQSSKWYGVEKREILKMVIDSYGK